MKKLTGFILIIIIFIALASMNFLYISTRNIAGVVIDNVELKEAVNTEIETIPNTTTLPLEEPEIVFEELVDEEDEEEDEPEEEEIIEETPEPEPQSQSIKIANFNAKIFGDSKWDKLGADFFNPLIQDYDIFFLQEIRDIDGSSFTSLCNGLEGYQCDISSRAGRSSSKEQYGVIYKDGITASLTDYNPDTQDRWERPPIKVEFDIDDYEIDIWNIHIKPSDVENEMNYLEEIVSDEGNVIVLGDLNLDCTYDDGMSGDFVDWNYLIEDNEDTTVKSTNCAYDRIILNDDAYEEYENDGIDTSISEDESDHYLVWVELEI